MNNTETPRMNRRLRNISQQNVRRQVLPLTMQISMQSLPGRATYSSSGYSLCISREILNFYVHSNPPIKRKGSPGTQADERHSSKMQLTQAQATTIDLGFVWPWTLVLCLLIPSFSVVWSSRWGWMRWPHQVRKILHAIERKANLTLETAEHVRWIWHLRETALPSQINTLVNKMM